MGRFRLLRPDQLMTAAVAADGSVTGATVVDNSSSVDAGYQPGWLCDLLVGRPVRGASTGLDLTVTGASRQVDLMVATHLRLDEAVALTIGGALSATLAGGVAQADGLPLHRYAVITAATAGGCTVAVVGNSVAPIVGELLIGESTALSRPLRLGASRGMQSFALRPAIDLAPMHGYDKRLGGETLSGSQYYTDEEVETLRQAWKSTRDGTLPIVVIPDDAKPECFVCAWEEPPSWTEDEGVLNLVTLTFREIPRTGW